MTRAQKLAALGCLLGLVLPRVAQASDHADPALHPPSTQDAGITGLFFFPKGEKMVVILNVHRGLTTPPPYELDEFEYTVYMDLTSAVTFGSAEDVARYGGTVSEPSALSSDARIRFRLRNDASLVEGYPRFEGLLGSRSEIETYSGVRDDPFIFPRFFETNIIAMAASIPMSAFPAGQRNWILWATTTRNGTQIDHVGRSNRTQLGRLDFLNTTPVRGQASSLHDKLDSGQKVQQGLMHLMSHLPGLSALSGLFEYVFQIRDYDVAPDVMIFTRDREAGFPNGRRLEDDVAALTCAQGDCVLQEIAFIEGEWPRSTINDKAFLVDFPYLAEPWPDRPATETKDWCGTVFWATVLVVALLAVARSRRRQRMDETPWVRPYRG